MATTKKKTATKNKDNEMEMVLAADLGNGWSKIKYSFVDKNGELVAPQTADFPSAVSYVPVGYKWVPAEATNEYIEDLVNKLDCDVKTPIIPEMDKRRMLVGERAAALSTSLIQFSVEDHIAKSDTALSYQLLFSAIASAAVEKYFEENGELPETSLHVNVDLAIALPFTDYVEHKDQYRTKLEDNRHTVNIHNFDIEIPVHITFDTVNVMAEGAAAMYAIGDLSPEFIDSALELAAEEGFDVDGLDGETVLGYSNVIGIDLGTKTTDLPLFLNGELEPAGSASLPNKGFGNVIENLLEAVRNTPYAVSSRNELENILLNEDPTPAQRAVQEKLLELEEFEADSLARDVVAEYKRVLAPVKMNIEAVYVFGGGATRMKDVLYEPLKEASEVAPSVYLPVIWMGTWSRFLNRNGLFMLARLAYENKEK